MRSRLHLFLLLSLLSISILAQDNAIMLEAEDADSIGSDFSVVEEQGLTYLTPLTDFAGISNPLYSYRVYLSPEYENVDTTTISSLVDFNFDSFKLYPNPANDYIDLYLPEGFKKGTIANIYRTGGKKLKSFRITSEYNKLEISDLESGLYILNTRINNNVKHLKFVKE